MRRPEAYPQGYLNALRHLAIHPPPGYTCPFCGKPVTQRPVKNHGLKAAVFIVQGIINDELEGEAVDENDSDVEGAQWNKYFV